jgi:hypothetical protein
MMTSALSSTRMVEHIHVRAVVVTEEQTRAESSNPSSICYSNRNIFFYMLPWTRSTTLVVL